MTIEPRRIVARIEAPVEDFLHYFAAEAPPEDAPVAAFLLQSLPRYGAELGRTLQIRDVAGNRLPCRIVEARLDAEIPAGLTGARLRSAGVQAVVTCEFTPPVRPRFLTLQQTLGAEAGLRVQFVLSVGGPGQPGAQLVTLTNRGNAETLQIDWPGSETRDDEQRTAQHATITCPERLRGVRVRAEIRPGEVTVETQVPLPLLETWFSLARSDPDFVSISEQADSIAPLRAFFAAHNPIAIDGVHVVPDRVDVYWLPPETDLAAGAAAPARLFATTSRVVGLAHYGTATPAWQLSIDWDLFNAAVFSATAEVIVDGTRREKDLSTYQPRLEWRRSEHAAERP